MILTVFFFFSSRRRHTRFKCDWSSDVCSSDLAERRAGADAGQCFGDCGRKAGPAAARAAGAGHRPDRKWPRDPRSALPRRRGGIHRAAQVLERMILATAGHIDHGKTALVRALTGVDADRLPEEKRRGLTIDLGFAYASLPDGTELGFVDVPGHERFLPNMLAGVLSIDRVLLIVAADDGPRPQTLEHLDILELIGIAEVTGVVTKVDRVPAERRAAVEAEVAALLAKT